MFRFWPPCAACLLVVPRPFWLHSPRVAVGWCAPGWGSGKQARSPDPGVPLHAPYVKCNREVREQMGSKKIILHFFTDYVQIAAQDFGKEIEFSDVKRLNERLT